MNFIILWAILVGLVGLVGLIGLLTAIITWQTVRIRRRAVEASLDAAKTYREVVKHGVGSQLTRSDSASQDGVVDAQGERTTDPRALEALAQQGDADAQFTLGGMYLTGQGVPQNHVTALKWYTLAAKQGLAIAQNDLGVMYLRGQGVPQDYEAALKWYRRAAEQGDALAQYNLGAIYLQGQGVLQNNKTALKWFTLAAEQGLVDAQYSLGVMYHRGHGVPQDNVYAHMWFNIAASSGHKDALERRDRVAQEMTPSQPERAQDLARAWSASHAMGAE